MFLFVQNQLFLSLSASHSTGDEEKIEIEDPTDTKLINQKTSPKTPSRVSRSSNVTASPTKISTRSSPKGSSQPIVSLTHLPVKSDQIHQLQDDKSPILTPTETEEDSLTSQSSVEKVDVEMTSDPLSSEPNTTKENIDATMDPLGSEPGIEKNDVEIIDDPLNSTVSMQKEGLGIPQDDPLASESSLLGEDIESSKDSLESESNVEENVEPTKDQLTSILSAEKNVESTENQSTPELNITEKDDASNVSSKIVEDEESLLNPEIALAEDESENLEMEQEPEDSSTKPVAGEELAEALDEPCDSNVQEKEEDVEPVPMDHETDESLNTNQRKETSMDTDNQESTVCIKEDEKSNNAQVNNKISLILIDPINLSISILIKEHGKSEPSHTARETRDRKRKRSPSPVEYLHKTLIPVKIEDEPDLDDSNVLLSWCKLIL